MTNKKILGSHVKRLLSCMSAHGTKHLTEVETDLIQTSLLLDEAIDKLSANFMAIHAAVCTQQATIDFLLAGGAPSMAARASLGAVQAEVGQHVNAAITSLQFQDMTSQLLERTLKRVGGMRDVLGTLGVHGAEMAPDSNHEEIAVLLGEVGIALTNQSLELRSELRQVVCQQHLESGDIELF